MKIRLISFSRKGSELEKKIADVLKSHECEAFARTEADVSEVNVVRGPMSKWVEESFKETNAIIFVGAVGIAVRYIAPFVKDKVTDPAIVSIDENGTFVIPLLSGHIGGSNDLAKTIAIGIGATPVITTATDINNKFSVDTFAVNNDMHIDSMHMAKVVSSVIVDERKVGFLSEIPVIGKIPDELDIDCREKIGIFISYKGSKGPFEKTLKLTPRCHILGIGCRKGISKEEISELVNEVLEKENISIDSVKAVASIDLKSDEEGLLDFCINIGVEPIFFTPEQLNSQKGAFTTSEMVRSVTGVDNVCERAATAASKEGKLILRKTSKDGVTLAIMRENVVARMIEG